MLLRRLRRAARRLSLSIILLAILPFLLEVVIHVRRYAVPRPLTELDLPFATSCQEPDIGGERENAVLVMLARNRERKKAKHTVRSVESHFNRWYNYPVLFLNDEPWDERFIRELNETAGGKGIFEVIPKDQWTFPDWVDRESAVQSIKDQGKAGVPHAGQEGYHHMCRFYSGAFYQLDVLKKYKWYWRLEPDVDFTCAVTYDPFVQMAKHKKVYGYTIALWEVGRSCPGLFRATADWKEAKGITTTSLWRAAMEASFIPFPFRRLIGWIVDHRDTYGDAWSLCHYWSNFEIADLDFFRSRAYQDYFDYLDKKGGFYYERWGDAAVHSLAIAMLAQPSQVHHFADLGYRHAELYQCPTNAPGAGQLPDSPSLADNKPWWPEASGGIGCRCECDSEPTRNFDSYCLDKLKQPNTLRQGWFS